MPLLTVATANIAKGLPPRHFLADLRRLTSSDAHSIGLQEVRTRENLLRAFLGDKPEWSLVMPNDFEHYSGSNAILFRNDVLEWRGDGVRILHDRVRARRPIPPRTCNYAEYRHRRTGEAIVHLNHHVTHFIDLDGRPRDLPRVEVATIGLHAVAAMVKDLRDVGTVVVTGDWNVDYRADQRVRDPRFPYVILHAAGLRATYDVLGLPPATHGRHRVIDVTYFEPRGALRPVGQNVLPRQHSDHRPVLTDFELDGRRDETADPGAR